MKALVPQIMPGWSDRARKAQAALQTAADAAVSSPTPEALTELRAARAEFGGALLDMDRARRPEMHRRASKTTV